MLSLQSERRSILSVSLLTNHKGVRISFIIFLPSTSSTLTKSQHLQCVVLKTVEDYIGYIQKLLLFILFNIVITTISRRRRKKLSILKLLI